MGGAASQTGVTTRRHGCRTNHQLPQRDGVVLHQQRESRERVVDGIVGVAQQPERVVEQDGIVGVAIGVELEDCHHEMTTAS